MAQPFGRTVTEAAHLSSSGLQREGVDFEVELTENCQQWPAPDIVRQILLNLIANAINAGKRHDRRPRRIVVRGRIVDGKLMIEVAFNSVSVGPKVAELLNRSFLTTDARKARWPLNMAQHSLERLGGDIRFEHHDEWSQFVVRIPSDWQEHFDENARTD